MNVTESLTTSTRLLMQVSLRPLQGTRFQPTGFPDIGAAEYTGYNAEGEQERMLLVESAQSMANRMEAVLWDEAGQDFIPELKGLPYVRVNDTDGEFLTSSILEAHRLNSVYIEKADGEKFHKSLKGEMGYADSKMIDNAKVAQALLKYDPNSLIHGVFMESIAGRIRLPRALTAFIEASDVQRAASGGVKNDLVNPGKDEEGTRSAKEGFGNVPFHRDEFSGKITAYFNLDLAQIQGYRFAPEAETLLVTLSLLKIRLLLERGLRLRTACDLDVQGEILVQKPTGFSLPSGDDLLEALPSLIKACEPFFATPAVTELTYEK